MSFFSRLFRRKKKKPDYEEIEEDLGYGGDARPLSPGHAAVDRCEAVIEQARELEDAKTEYRIVTAYLSDVELLQDLPEDEKKALKETAEQVVELNRSREKLLKKEKKISDRDFREMEREERSLPDAIERFTANETYLATLERDMGYLESEKIQWEMYTDDYRDSVKRRKLILKVLLWTALFFVVFALILQIFFKLSLMGFIVIGCAVLAIAAFFLYLRGIDEEREIMQCVANRNHAIRLLNKVKVKYVNVKNAVDYTAEKYHVRNSRELLKKWENYQEAVRERAKYQSNSEELEFYTAKLQKLLHKEGLYDENVWLLDPVGLTDPRELVEIKHNMIVRRQKLRARIEYGMDRIRAEQREIEKLLEKDPEGRSEIEGILRSIYQIVEEGE